MPISATQGQVDSGRFHGPSIAKRILISTEFPLFFRGPGLKVAARIERLIDQVTVLLLEQQHPM
jgi:hypothetical protein